MSFQRINPDLRPSLKWLRPLCLTALGLSVLVAGTASLHWPLIGDASLMHYIVFLHRQGLTPYRDVVDINLPGTYIAEAIAMRLFGDGALAWRLYDLFLLGSVIAASVVLSGRHNRFAGILAGSLFALIHLQDGLAQGGQRDLLMASLLLGAYIALPVNGKANQLHRTLIFGLLLGATLTIKPVLLPLGLILLALSFWQARRSPRARTTLLAGLVGIAIPPVAMLRWLHHAAALDSFLHLATGLMLQHARMGRQTLPYLLSHCLSPVAPLAALWLVIVLIDRPLWSTGRIHLALGTAGALLAYLIQGKGYPYQRYPLLAMLLLLIATDLTRALTHRGPVRWLAAAACALACVILAPRYARLTTTFSPQTPFQSALAEHLLRLAPTGHLTGEVQCFDTFGGCINILYALKVRQATGFLYDCYLFSGAPVERDRYRVSFWSAYQYSRPRIVVATSQFCFGDPRGFAKLTLWPLLADDLTRNYTLADAWSSPVPQHWWSRKEDPPEFRIYLRKTE